MRNLILCLLILAPLGIAAQEPDPETPTELLEIFHVDYPRNAKASFCRRPIEMVDTIVFHHTETSSLTTPLEINDMHLNRGTPNDPWLMVAYSYQVNVPYPGNQNPSPKVTEGRPLDIVGAHAGSQVFVPMDPEQKRMWDNGEIICGVEGGSFSVDPKQLNEKGHIKANVTTIGVDVIGNYAPFSRDNPDGWRPSRPRYPTPATIDLLARLSCQLQKKYPRMKFMRWHNFYHTTSCPGTIKDYVPKIREAAKGYGCEFN